jgi:ribonucleotide reductase beta subunit family protein with ferritin-like domain
LIAADEALHVEFAGELYRHLVRDGYTHVPQQSAHAIIRDAVRVVTEFTQTALNVDLIGLSCDEMIQYIQCCGDEISHMFGYEPIYNTVNPFVWMNSISLPKFTNFFESRNLTYTRAKVSNEIFDVDVDTVDF